MRKTKFKMGKNQGIGNSKVLFVFRFSNCVSHFTFFFTVPVFL